MKLRAEGVALDESFNQLKLWLQVWGPMKFQPDETLAEGVALDESFNRMKLWSEVRCGNTKQCVRECASTLRFAIADFLLAAIVGNPSLT